ncbi:MAG TPA: flagellar basal body rod C-terminal domain-containing protein, partial [Burkholderiaceae bacterium]
SGNLAASDSFLLEPVAQAAQSMTRILANTNGIAAASPVTAITDITNTGTGTVDSIFVVNSSFDPSKQPITLQFGAVDPSDNSVTYTMTLADSTVLTGNWKPGDVLGNTPPGIGLGFELRLSGVPRDGDTFEIQKTQFPASNNGNAKAFLAIQTDTFVGRSVLPDGSIRAGSTPSDAYAATMADIGTRVQSAQYLSDVSTSVADSAETTRSNGAGVNLDEEATRLMQYQQGYQAAARVLQTAQTVFDELLQLGR